MKFGTEARCIEGAALLQQTAAHLGFTFTPRPVGVLVANIAEGRVAMLGSAAEDHVPPGRRADILDLRPGGQGAAGHVVLTSSDPLRLLDPTLTQTANVGIAAPPVVMAITSEHPAKGGWSFVQGPLEVTYVTADDDRRLLDDYDDVLASYAHAAKRLARMIRR